MIFGSNRKRIFDFLLVRHSNLGPILHRFWDTATYWLKLQIFHTPLSQSTEGEHRGEAGEPLTRRPRGPPLYVRLCSP